MSLQPDRKRPGDREKAHTVSTRSPWPESTPAGRARTAPEPGTGIKLGVSLPDEDVVLLGEHAHTRGLALRSAAMRHAARLPRDDDLERGYTEAVEERDASAERNRLPARSEDRAWTSLHRQVKDVVEVREPRERPLLPAPTRPLTPAPAPTALRS